MFLCPTRLSARSGVSVGGSVWLYVFDHPPSDDSIWANLTFCFNHTCHGAELPFLFDSAPSTNLTLTPQETLLANQMACYWGAFAHAGDPNSRGEQTPFCREQKLSVWPRYTSTEGWSILNLTLQSHPQYGNRDHFCDFWDSLDIYWGVEIWDWVKDAGYHRTVQKSKFGQINRNSYESIYSLRWFINKISHFMFFFVISS